MKDSPELDDLKGYRLLNEVLRKSELRRVNNNLIPVKYIYIISDGQDILSFKNVNSEKRSIYLSIHPEFTSLLRPNLKSIISEKTQDLYNIKQYFDLSYENGLKEEDVFQIRESDLAIRTKESIVIPKVVFIEADSAVNLIAKSENVETSPLNIMDTVLTIDKNIYQIDELSTYLIGQLLAGKLLIPTNDGEIY